MCALREFWCKNCVYFYIRVTYVVAHSLCEQSINKSLRRWTRQEYWIYLLCDYERQKAKQKMVQTPSASTTPTTMTTSYSTEMKTYHSEYSWNTNNGNGTIRSAHWVGRKIYNTRIRCSSLCSEICDVRDQREKRDAKKGTSVGIYIASQCGKQFNTVVFISHSRMISRWMRTE